MQHFSRPDHLYLDFDFPRPDRRSPRLRPFFTVLRMMGLKLKRGTMMLERTEHGWHVVMQVTQKLLPSETVALQSLMGSDGRREALNLMRALQVRRGVSPYWQRRWNILFAGKLK